MIGFVIVLAVNVRVASKNGQLGCVEVRWGLRPMDGAIVRLANMCGFAASRADSCGAGTEWDA